jgi:hypothetical protein
MLPGQLNVIQELRRGLICALLIAMLWAALYFVMGVSTVSAILAAMAAAVVRLATCPSRAHPG